MNSNPALQSRTAFADGYRAKPNPSSAIAPGHTAPLARATPSPLGRGLARATPAAMRLGLAGAEPSPRLRAGALPLVGLVSSGISVKIAPSPLTSAVNSVHDRNRFICFLGEAKHVSSRDIPRPPSRGGTFWGCLGQMLYQDAIIGRGRLPLQDHKCRASSPLPPAPSTADVPRSARSEGEPICT